MSVVLITMVFMLLLSFLVMGLVALPQLRAGKTMLSQTGMDRMDVARRRAASLAGRKGEARPVGEMEPGQRLRSPVGWTAPTNGPRHAR